MPTPVIAAKYNVLVYMYTIHMESQTTFVLVYVPIGKYHVLQQ